MGSGYVRPVQFLDHLTVIKTPCILKWAPFDSDINKMYFCKFGLSVDISLIIQLVVVLLMMKVMTMMIRISYLREDLVGWCLLPSCLATRDWQ